MIQLFIGFHYLNKNRLWEI